MGLKLVLQDTTRLTSLSGNCSVTDEPDDQEGCDLRRLRYSKHPLSKNLETTSTQKNSKLVCEILNNNGHTQTDTDSRVKVCLDVSRDVSANPLPASRSMLQKFKQQLLLMESQKSIIKKNKECEQLAVDVSFGAQTSLLRRGSSIQKVQSITDTKGKMKLLEPSARIKANLNKSLNPDTERAVFDLSTGLSGSGNDVTPAQKYCLSNTILKVQKKPRTNASHRLKLFRRSRDQSLSQCSGDLDDTPVEMETHNTIYFQRETSKVDIRPSLIKEGARKPSIDLRVRRPSLKSSTSNDTDGLFMVKHYNRHDSQRRSDVFVQKSHLGECSNPAIRPVIKRRSYITKEPHLLDAKLLPPNQASLIAPFLNSDRSIAGKTLLSNEGDFCNVPNFSIDRIPSRLQHPSPKISNKSQQSHNDSGICAEVQRALGSNGLVGSKEQAPLDTNIDLEAIFKNSSAINLRKCP